MVSARCTPPNRGSPLFSITSATSHRTRVAWLARFEPGRCVFAQWTTPPYQSTACATSAAVAGRTFSTASGSGPSLHARHSMTDAQKALLKEQAARRRTAKETFQREDHILRAMLVLHDERFSDSESGLSFDDEACVIVESGQNGRRPKITPGSVALP